MPYLIVIAGPTGVGKTELAIKLANEFITEIISADARQFYRELNIGVAKPTDDQLKKIKHHFINSLSIHDHYDVGKFEKDVIQLLDNLFEKYETVLLVGGSGLFIKAVTEGLDKLPEANDELRKQLSDKLKIEGIQSLQQLLKETDVTYYNEVDLNNPRRLMRALEVCIISGKPYSSFKSYNASPRNFKSVKVCLNTDRKKLYEQINIRIDEMIEAGLLLEVKLLYPYKDLNALNTVGYKEFFQYLDGKINYDQAVNLIKQNTRNYAKRQITWFKKQPDYKWFEPSDENEILNYINEIISHQP